MFSFKNKIKKKNNERPETARAPAATAGQLRGSRGVMPLSPRCGTPIAPSAEKRVPRVGDRFCCTPNDMCAFYVYETTIQQKNSSLIF